jgi:hypothetical protein
MRTLGLPSYPLRAVHLLAVWAYAVSQPIFSLLEANPEFLVVRGSSRSEVVVFALLLVFVPPLLAVACELAVRLFSIRAADVVHLAFLGALVVPLALYLLKELDAGAVPAVLAVGAAALGAVWLYARFRAVGLFLSFSLMLPLVGLYWFLFEIPLAASADVRGANVHVSARTPVVILVLDELPASSLMTASREIDAQRYPAFARLGRRATWYRSTTTVHEHTTHAVPAILDGGLPEDREVPTVRDHPHNLFTLLGESYEVRSFEPLTHLCPRRYCESGEEGSLGERLRSLFSDVRVAYLHRTLPDSLAGGLPSIDDRWGGFGAEAVGHGDGDGDLILAAGDEGEAVRINRGAFAERDPRGDFERFLSSFDTPRGPRPTLHFLHLLLPHGPWYTLPSGRQYGNAPTDGLDGDEWGDDPRLVAQAHQRHLLQVAYTDRLLGRLLRRLDDAGLYERSLVVVAADHGASFVHDGRRRHVTPSNLADVARVPLFVKLPGQTHGRIDDRPAQTIDILPTIADALDIELPWAVDGRSLLGRGPAPREVSVWSGTRPAVQSSVEAVERALRNTVRRQSRLFAPGVAGLFDLGTHRQLLGTSVSASVQTTRATRVELEREDLLADVRLSSAFVPAFVAGSLEGTPVADGVELAIAVNGRVAALTRPFRRGEEQRFSALVPEQYFRDGANRVDVLVIGGIKAHPGLLRIGETGSARQ